MNKHGIIELPIPKYFPKVNIEYIEIGFRKFKNNIALGETAFSNERFVNSLKLNNSQWIGALYYSLTPFKRGKKDYYLLLGWDGNDERSNRKIMDVLSISKSLTFGAPIFR